jgi:hypothetical protein
MYDWRLFAVGENIFGNIANIFGNIAKKRLSFGASIYNCPNTAIELEYY